MILKQFGADLYPGILCEQIEYGGLSLSAPKLKVLHSVIIRQTMKVRENLLFQLIHTIICSEWKALLLMEGMDITMKITLIRPSMAGKQSADALKLRGERL